MAGFGASKLVQFIRRNKDRVCGSNFIFSVLMPHKTLAFEDIDLVFPIVTVKRRVSSRLDREMSHCECWSAHRLVKQPLNLHTFRPLFLNRRILFRVDVHLAETHRNHENDVSA